MAKTELNGIDILDGGVKIEDLDSSLIDGPPLSSTLRTLGTGSNQAVAGDDPRLSDKRPSGELCYNGGEVIISGSAAPAVGQTLIASSAGEAVWGYLSGSYGDPDATYLVVAGTGSLANERTILDGDGINFIDGGSNGNFTILVDPTIIPYLTGANTFTGANIFAGGISGSLQSLSDGTPYIIGGAGITAVTGANGSITLQLDNPIPGESDATYLVIGTTSSLTNERSISIGNGLSFTDNGANGSYEIFIDTTIVPNLTGTNNFTGQNTIGNLTGSITKVPGGGDYLRAGDNITLATGSDGSVEISSETPIRQEQFIVFSSTSSLPNALILNPGIGLDESQVGSDLTYFVDPSVIPYLTGNNNFSGNNQFTSGLSGSLQNLTTGESYLVAGNGINVLTGSNGQITISSIPTAAGADGNASYVVIGTTSSLPNERALVGTSGEIDIIDGGANGNVQLSLATLPTTGSSFGEQLGIDDHGRIVTRSPARVHIKDQLGNKTVYSTISDALSAALEGEIVVVGPGTWSENLTIPEDVCVVSECGSEKTIIEGVSSASGTRISLGTRSSLTGFTVQLPNNSDSGIICGQATGTNMIEDIKFVGGSSTSPNALRKTGSSTLIAKNVKFSGQSANSAICIEAGRLCMHEFFFENGTVDSVFKIIGGSLEMDSTKVATGTVASVFLIEGNGKIISNNLYSGAASVFAIFDNDEYIFCLKNGNIENATSFLEFDLGLLNDDAFLDISDTTTSNSLILAPNGYFDSDRITVDINDSSSNKQRKSFLKDVEIGRCYARSSIAVGNGLPQANQITVFTTDSSANIFSDGGNFLDVSAQAIDDGTTFSFQGSAAGHSILFCSNLEDSNGKKKHWGIVHELASAATGGVFAIDVWSGGLWLPIQSMSAQIENVHNYGTNHLLRANNEEIIVFESGQIENFGAQKTINGVSGVWCRIRIQSAPATVPSFKKLAITQSSFSVGKEGRRVNFGLSKFTHSVFVHSNIWGEQGSVTNRRTFVGNGGSPGQSWNHQMKNCFLNSLADALNFQVMIPKGVSTAHPIFVKMIYENVTAGGGNTTTPVIRTSVLPIEISGVQTAENNSNIEPSARTQANTETKQAKAASSIVRNLNNRELNKFHQISTGGFSIENYQSGDLLFCRVAFNTRGAPAVSINIIGLEIEFTKWTDGGNN